MQLTVTVACAKSPPQFCWAPPVSDHLNHFHWGMLLMLLLRYWRPQAKFGSSSHQIGSNIWFCLSHHPSQSLDHVICKANSHGTKFQCSSVVHWDTNVNHSRRSLDTWIKLSQPPRSVQWRQGTWLGWSDCLHGQSSVQPPANTQYSKYVKSCTYGEEKLLMQPGNTLHNQQN